MLGTLKNSEFAPLDARYTFRIGIYIYIYSLGTIIYCRNILSICFNKIIICISCQGICIKHTLSSSDNTLYITHVQRCSLKLQLIKFEDYLIYTYVLKGINNKVRLMSAPVSLTPILLI